MKVKKEGKALLIKYNNYICTTIRPELLDVSTARPTRNGKTMITIPHPVQRGIWIPCYVYLNYSEEQIFAPATGVPTTIETYRRYAFYDFVSYLYEESHTRLESFYIGILKPNQQDPNNYFLSPFSVEDEEHWYTLLWFLKQWPEKYFVHTLTLLLNYNLTSHTIDSLKSAIRRFPNDWKDVFFTEIQKAIPYGSYYNQEVIKQVFHEWNYQYEIIYENDLKKIILQMGQSESSWKQLNFFRQVDFIYEHAQQEKRFDNAFFNLCLWAKGKESILPDNDVIIRFFPYFDETIQLQIVRRYFYDIKLQKREFSLPLLKSLKNHPYSFFNVYRHNSRYYQEPMNIGVQLLLDSIITYQENKEFQTFNGIIDLYVQSCNSSYNKVNLGEAVFLNLCEGGISESPHFTGFVTVKDVISINKSRFERNNIVQTIQDVLNHYYQKVVLPIPLFKEKEGTENGFHEPAEVLESYQLCCWELKKYQDLTGIQQFAKVIGLDFPDLIYEDYINDLQIDEKEILNRTKELFNTSLALFEDKWILEKEKICEDIIDSFCDQYYLISPRKDICLSEDLSFSTNLRENILSEVKRIGGVPTETHDKYIVEATAELTSSINSYFNIKDPKEEEELKQLKEEIKSLKVGSYERKVKESKLKEYTNFLIKWNLRRGTTKVCAPHKNDKTNPFTQTSFFWCQNRSCFHSNIELHKDDWNAFTLIDMMSILEIRLTEQSSSGLYPVESYQRFVDQVKKVNRMTSHLQCKECGHILFPDEARNPRNHGFYRYYKCHNPHCNSNTDSIYLNFCNNCKTGIIDERESKKCPNGSVICRRCLSCCSNEMFQMIANNAIAEGRSIPLRIQRLMGHGHFDEGTFYCPDCGNMLTPQRYCENCGFHQ